MSVASIAQLNRDPVAGGFYTVKEAARLLNIHNASVITAWVRGRTGSASGPIIKRQYQPIGGHQELGFWDLLEVRFVDQFRKEGYSLQTLRKAADTAREALNKQHPFALYGAKIIGERKNILLQTARTSGDKSLLNLLTKQYAIYEVLEEALAQGIMFDPMSGLAQRWKPKEKEFPHVVVDPTIAYGQPALEGPRVPTNAIFNSWKAEDGNFAAVADWFEIEENLTREAVGFELALPN